MKSFASKVCLITGVGPGTGLSCVKKFAEAGYKVAMIARNKERLNNIENTVQNSKAFPCDVSNLENLKNICEKVILELGEPSVVIHNAIAGILEGGASMNFLDGDASTLERNFRVNTTSLLYLTRAIVPGMLKAKEGSIIVTGNTAALRGKPNFAFFAPTKAAQRVLAQSMAKDFGPKGVHVAYVLIDAAINTSRTRPIVAANKPDEFFCEPNAIADQIFHVAHQERSAWSFDVEIRPNIENW